MSHSPTHRIAACATTAVAAAALLAAGQPAAFGQSSSAGHPHRACSAPAAVIGLSSNWKIQLPVEDPDTAGKPLEITQPQLATYKNAPWFTTTSDCKAALFRAAVNGATTTNTGYPRSELREMTSSGTKTASWSSTSGTSTMTVDEAVTHLPNDKPHVMAGQIHDDSSDVTSFRLEGTSLYVTSYNTTHYKLVTANYKLGTRFQGKFVVSGGNVKVYYNGTLEATVAADFASGYFKAGDYTQANCGNSSPCSTSNYAEVALYGVSITHS